jgi:2-iminobutanoate/2-iminopropanoate deaminase
MANMAAMLKASDRGFDDVVKTTIYLTDLADFVTVNEVYGEFFGDVPPARACVQVAALPKGSEIEIEWIATA